MYNVKHTFRGHSKQAKLSKEQKTISWVLFAFLLPSGLVSDPEIEESKFPFKEIQSFLALQLLNC